MGVSCDNMGNGKVPLLPVWQAVHIGDQPETIGGNLQEALGGDLFRIQCLVVRSFPYQHFNVRYRKDVEIPLDDTLSRVTPLPTEEDGIQLPIIAVNQVTSNIPYSSNDLDQIHEETRKDPMLKLLMHYICERWPCE